MTLRFSIFTLFPEMFAGPFGESIIRRAIDSGLVEIAIYDLRTWTHDRHRTADDRPYGGGAGMVLMAPPIVEGVEQEIPNKSARKFITSAGGRTFDQQLATELLTETDIVLICGHYEGIDARAGELLGAEEISIGDYVLTGGELPAMVIVDAVTRLIPGVIDDTIDSRGVASGRSGGISALHAARRISRTGSSARVTQRSSRSDRCLATSSSHSNEPGDAIRNRRTARLPEFPAKRASSKIHVPRSTGYTSKACLRFHRPALARLKYGAALLMPLRSSDRRIF